MHSEHFCSVYGYGKCQYFWCVFDTAFFSRPSKFEDNNLCHLIVAKDKIKFHHHSLEGLMILVASFAADGK